jgi:hypothetical protein
MSQEKDVQRQREMIRAIAKAIAQQYLKTKGF